MCIHLALIKKLHRLTYRAKLNNVLFHPLEDVSRYRDLQFQVRDSYSYLFILRPNICKYCILNNSDLIG